EERADAPWPLVPKLERSLGDGGKAPDAGADDDAGAAPVRLVLGGPAGVAHRLVGCGHGVEDEVVDPPLILRAHHLVRVEGALDLRPALAAAVDARDLAGYLAGIVGRIEGADPVRARAAGEDGRPGPLV